MLKMLYHSLIATFLSATLYLFSIGFHDHWILAWLAPLPILIFALRFGYLPTLVVSFLGFALGNSDVLYYFPKLLRIEPVFFASLFNALSFAMVILISRWIILRLRHWVAIFAFPSLWTSFEFFCAADPQSGTFGSIAYSQAHVLPLIQITSLTGIWAITFLLCLIPSSVAVTYFLHRDRKNPILGISISFILLISVVLFGIIRINQVQPQNFIRVGLIATPATLAALKSTEPQQVMKTILNYAKSIHSLANKQVQVVLLPEKIARVLPSYQDQVFAEFSQIANKNHINLIAGIAQEIDAQKYNMALLYSPEGVLLEKYNKQHRLPGPESDMIPGNSLVLFKIENQLAGIAICKDMDFIAPARLYGQAGVKVLFVPALDFVTDGWLHARIAVIQGVANGYSVVRAAQWGLLSVSDAVGHIIMKISTQEEAAVVLLASVPAGPGTTFYAKHGDWFAWICAALGVILIALALTPRKYSH